MERIRDERESTEVEESDSELSLAGRNLSQIGAADTLYQSGHVRNDSNSKVQGLHYDNVRSAQCFDGGHSFRAGAGQVRPVGVQQAGREPRQGEHAGQGQETQSE